jgi:hypothetical protein
MENHQSKERKFPQNQRLSKIIESSQQQQQQNDTMIDSFEKVFEDEFTDFLDTEIGEGTGSIEDFLNDYQLTSEVENTHKSKKIKEEKTNTNKSVDTGICESKSREEKVIRVRDLVSFPAKLSRYLNSGDDERLKGLIYDACTEDCKFKTPAMPKEVKGRDVIVECFLALSRSIPDYIMQFRAPSTLKRVIMASFESSGTRVVHDAAEYLFDHLQYGRNDNVSFVRAQQLVQAIEASGKHAFFRGKSVMHLIVNEEMTHIEKIIVIRKSIAVMPAKEEEEEEEET